MSKVLMSTKATFYGKTGKFILRNLNMAKERYFSGFEFAYIHTHIGTYLYIAFLKDVSFHSEDTIQIVAN